MSYCKEDGKDQVIFATKEDLDGPSSAIINIDTEEEDEQPGLILPNGDINWECPCLGGMASGPCGTQFRDAFSCFHYSEAEPKGSDCYDAFLTMQQCMSGYPELYPPAKAEADEVGQLKGLGEEDSDATHNLASTSGTQSEPMSTATEVKS